MSSSVLRHNISYRQIFSNCWHDTVYNDIFIFLTDIDECASAFANKCDSKANCTNTEGSYNCTCFKGYSGNGTNCTGKNYF